MKSIKHFSKKSSYAYFTIKYITDCNYGFQKHFIKAIINKKELKLILNYIYLKATSYIF